MLTYRNGMQIGFIGAMGAASQIAYVPDLAPVGSGASYFPRDVEQDAKALNFLGFLSDVDDANRFTSNGNQSEDIQNQSGAWDPAFRAAVTRAQAALRLTVDSWIGPQTRTALAAAVATKNASGFNPPLPSPGVIIPVAPGKVPVPPDSPAPPGTVVVAKKDDTLMWVGIGAGVLAVGGLAYYAIK